jgi:hypothetical protein
MFRASQCPSSGARQTAIVASGFRMYVEVEVFSAVVGLLVTNRPRLRTLPPPHSYGNQRLRLQFDGLLMMGIVMPETCWAVSVRQGNKFYDWLLHLVVYFIRETYWVSPRIYSIKQNLSRITQRRHIKLLVLWLHSFRTSVLNARQRSALHPGRFKPGKR